MPQNKPIAKLIARELERQPSSYSKEEILRNAKARGLFQHNKYLQQYEIIIPKEEYEKL